MLLSITNVRADGMEACAVLSSDRQVKVIFHIIMGFSVIYRIFVKHYVLWP